LGIKIAVKMTSAERNSLIAYREKLMTIMLTGARRVTHGGKTVEFNTIADIQALISQIDIQLDKNQNPRVQQVFVKRLV